MRDCRREIKPSEAGDDMTTSAQESSELERRIRLLEDPSNQGAEFDTASWIWLIVLGIVLPAAVFVWGWW